MSLVKSVKEIIRERMDECADAGAEQFINAVRPIYGSDERENPFHIGSCILVAVNNNNFLITAAHIADELNISKLYIGAEDRLVELDNKFCSSDAPNGDRKKDHFDISLLKVSESLENQLVGLDFLTEDKMCQRFEYTSGRQYLALGYPRSKNKKFFRQDASIKSHLFKYTSVVKKDDGLCAELSVSGHQHLFLDFDSKYSKDYNGNVVNSINPTGVSGGALIDMGRLANPEQFKIGASCVGQLAGMLIENKSEYKAMVALRIDTVVKAIKKYGNLQN